jgi:hypothetical protein
MKWLLLVSAEIVYLAVLFLPDARARLPAYLALVAVASLLAIAAAAILSGARPAFVLLAAILFRATLLPRAPDLSDDMKRYLWDARVAAAGISPWAYAPQDRRVARLSPAESARLPHRDVKSVYPPVAEAAFRVGSLGGRSSVVLKTLFAAADVAVVWLLLRGGGASAAALYAFHPLPVLEIAGQGHLDSVGVALLLASLAFLSGGRAVRAGIAFAFSVLTKYVSIAAAPALFLRSGRRFAAVALLAASTLWLAALRIGASPVGGLPDYASRWQFNSVLYPAVEHAVSAGELPVRAKAAFLVVKARLKHPAWMQSIFPYFYDAFFARVILGFLLAASLVGIALRVRDPRTATFASLAVLLLLSPTLHPWYLLWILPFAAERREPAFLYLSFAAPLSYLLLKDAGGTSRALVLAAEYAPFAGLLLATLFRVRTRGPVVPQPGAS